VKEFVTRLGATYKREENVNKRDPVQLERFLWALENPDKVKIHGEDGKLRPLLENQPWWKRMLMFWKR